MFYKPWYKILFQIQIYIYWLCSTIVIFFQLKELSPKVYGKVFEKIKAALFPDFWNIGKTSLNKIFGMLMILVSCGY